MVNGGEWEEMCVETRMGGEDGVKIGVGSL